MKTRVVLMSALVVIGASGSAAAASDVVGQWHLDEGSGSAVLDSSGNGNNGIVQGAAQWTAGRFGAALLFDGSTGRVTVSDNAALEPSGAVSVSAWVKSAGSPGDFRYIVAKGATGCTAASYGLYTGPGGGLEFYVSEKRGTAYARSADPGPVVWNGQWHMVIGTFDGAVVRLFVDGVEIGTGTQRQGSLQYTLPDSNDFYVGDYPGCQQHNFKGAIDDVTVRQLALSANQIRDEFAQANQMPLGPAPPGGNPKTPPSPPGPGTSGAGSGHNQPGAPFIRALQLSPKAFALTTSRTSRSRHIGSGTTISYIDSRRGLSTITLWLRHSGVLVRGRCSQPRTGRGRAHPPNCALYTRAGSFTHSDVPGRNRFLFAGIRGRTLRPGRYRLDISPSSGGQVGRTVSTTFTILS